MALMPCGGQRWDRAIADCSACCRFGESGSSLSASGLGVCSGWLCDDFSGASCVEGAFLELPVRAGGTESGGGGSCRLSWAVSAVRSVRASLRVLRRSGPARAAKDSCVMPVTSATAAVAADFKLDTSAPRISHVKMLSCCNQEVETSCSLHKQAAWPELADLQAGSVRAEAGPSCRASRKEGYRHTEREGSRQVSCCPVCVAE